MCMIPKKSFISILIVMILLQITSCKKFIDVQAPPTGVYSEAVYASDATAIAVITGIYVKLSPTTIAISNDGLTTNMSVLPALSADELNLWDLSNASYLSYYKNYLSANNNGGEFWSFIYPHIYTCNAAIAGIEKSETLSFGVKNQLIGEAKFLRAFFYFYLTNFYGDVPLLLSTDYKKNSVLDRAPKSLIYSQIVTDLKDAQSLLKDVYVGGDVLAATNERVRPNKWSATAMLARVYLYQQDWSNAEKEASNVIQNVNLYDTVKLSNVFLKNSKEAIWQLQPVTTSPKNTQDARLFIIPSTGPNVNNPLYISPRLLNSFETGDKRISNWLGKYTDTAPNPDVNYYYSYKYKINDPAAPVSEYYTVLRLAEQYLIRAEARARIDKLAEARVDLNVIRTRAGLSNSNSTDKAVLINEITHERQVELFTEWGHRWLDLKRTETVNGVMSAVAPLKGGAWSSNWQLYPIPLLDLQRNPNLSQNPGY